MAKIPNIGIDTTSEFRNIINLTIDTVNGQYNEFNELLEVSGNNVEKAEELLHLNQNVQKQINDIILAEGQSDAEVIQARAGYAVLNERLDDMSDSSLRNSVQPDYVRKLIDLMHFDEVHVKKSTAKDITVTNFNKSTGRHLSNIFTKNANDDYWILSDSYVGGTTYAELEKEFKNYTLVSGNINTTYATHYAETKGTKVKVEIAGSSLYIRRFMDNKGGMWKAIVDGDTANPIMITTYSSTAKTEDYRFITGLADKTHTVEMEFIGDDPNNAPSTGAGTSRGWLVYNATVNNSMTFKSYFLNLSLTREKTINVANSNKDFALLIRKAGTTGEYFFVPEHNGIGTAFKITDPQFLLDGKVLDLNTMTLGVNITGKKFTLNQSVYGRDPVSKENLLRVDTVHEIAFNGSVRIIGKVQALSDVEIKDGYFLMLPVNNDSARRLKSSRYNYYPTVKNDGTQTALSAEKDDTSSYIFTSDANTNLFSALTIHDTLHTLRTGLEGKFPEGNRTWIEHRASSTMQKLYNSIFRFGTMKANEVLTFDGTYLSGELNNIHNVI